MKNLTQKIVTSAKNDYDKYDHFVQNRERLIDRFKGDKKNLVAYLLDYIILSVITAASFGVDLIQSLEDYYKGEFIRIWIPIVPPGINATYGVNCKGKQKVYKTKEAKEWEKAAIMPIRSAANSNDFLIDKENDRLLISVLIKGSQHDVDAPIKMIMDTVASVLGFNDKIVVDVRSHVKRDSDDRGVLIEIEKES